MACRQLLFCFVFTCMLFLIISPSHSSSDNDVAKVPSPARFQKVNLNLYYESLCPFCGKFIVNGLANIFRTDLINIVNLRLVPWGNAKIVQPNNTIVCQHGEDECYLNIIQACAINVWPDVKKHFSFISCVEKNQAHDAQDQHSGGAEAVWKTCCEDLKLSQELIQNCYDSGKGRELILQYAAETEHLIPPLEYVPWVTVNGKATHEDFENFVAHVCKAYKGKPLPKACRLRPSNSIDNENSIRGVCHTDEAKRAETSWMKNVEPSA